MLAWANKSESRGPLSRFNHPLSSICAAHIFVCPPFACIDARAVLNTCPKCPTCPRIPHVSAQLHTDVPAWEKKYKGRVL